MKIRLTAHLFLALSLAAGALALTPTKLRVWTSTSGTKITAKALDLTTNHSVELETKDGRKINLSLENFSQEDQTFLEEHFREEKKESPSGEHRGPIQADANTSYYLYLPADIDPSVHAPIMIWTQSEGGEAGSLKRFEKAADLLGMIIAIPVEAKFDGEATLINNYAHSNDVLRKLKRDFSINEKALHFGGDHSGGAAAFYNSIKHKSSGTFTVSGFFTKDKELKGQNEGYHFMAGGASSPYRYLTAWAASKLDDSAIHYYYEGGRELPKENDVTTGMVWMYSQGLYENFSSRKDEAKGFEKRILPWLKEKAKTSPNEAAFLVRTLSENCTLRGNFKQEIKQLNSILSQNERAAAYLKALDALDKFSEDEMTQYGDHHAPLHEHAPMKFKRITNRLVEKNPLADSLKPLFEQLAQPTHK